ncbi:MAG: tRNA lysidine(34) synthetase TilS [Cellulosilyticaceae bacterium]
MTREIDEKVKQYIAQHHLIEHGDRIIVGVSGGADSMMLLHFLRRHQEWYDMSLMVAHVHHGLRQEADEEAAYVEEVATQWGLPCERKQCDIEALAQEWRMSEEETGRKVRYDFFISLTNQGDKIATAHHMNDQAETMMMRFVRGTDIQGLQGIPPKRGAIIRPILGITREEVEYYCNKWQIHYKQDATNFETVYTRNKMRLECIPYMTTHFNPNLVATMARQAENFKEADDFLKTYTQEVFERAVNVVERGVKLTLDKELITQEKSYIQKRIFMQAILVLLGHTKEITTMHLSNILMLMNKQSGKQIDLPHGIHVKNEYNQLIFILDEEVKISNYEYTLQMGTTNVKEVSLVVQLRVVSFKTFEQRQENMYTKYIDYDKIKDSLQIRNRRPSDQIILPGGTKKLKKFFVDEKIPGHLRNTIPMIADSNNIIWVIGSRLNSKYYVTDKTTQILELTVLKEHTLQEGLC